MKIETKASILHGALVQLGRVIERRNTIPILSCVMLDGRKIRGTDLDMELEIDLPADRAKGSICVDHATLAGIVRHLPGDDDVTITGGKEGATVTFANGRYDLPSLPASDYPEVLADRNMKPVKIDGDALKKALAFITPFISTEQTRSYLNGICLDSDKAVATDGHRLGCHPTGCDFSEFDRPIIPRKAVGLLNRLPAASSAKIATDRPGMRFALPGARLATKLIDGTYPDWRRVVPKDLSMTGLSFDPARVLPSLRRAWAMRRSTSMPAATLAWDEGRAVLVTNSPDHGTAREYLAGVECQGKGTVAFNIAYLVNLLGSFRGCDLVTAIADPNGGPLTIRADGEAFALLMPMLGQDDKLAGETLQQWATAQEVGRAA